MCEAFILMYSVTSRSSFSWIATFHDQITSVKAQEGGDMMDGVPIFLVVGNKSDRMMEREVSTVEEEDLARQLRCEFIETSALRNQNVEIAFVEIVRRLQLYRDSRPHAPRLMLSKNHPVKAGRNRRCSFCRASGLVLFFRWLKLNCGI